ncbi:MAG: hypothetical protein D6718_04075 [Acidobacteria bacterium]|nr:MAG: hypothetical protein D6718_04075 [Acidobacteriota bacterium]
MSVPVVDRTTPVLLGGLIGAALGFLPPCCVPCCCVQALFAGLIAGALYARAAAGAGHFPDATEGLLPGLLAGLLAGAIDAILLGALQLLAVSFQWMPAEPIAPVPGMHPGLASLFETFGRLQKTGAGLALLFLVRFVTSAVISSLVGALFGMAGVALFRKPAEGIGAGETRGGPGSLPG